MICDSDNDAQNYTTLDGIMGLILVDVVSDEFLQRFSRWSFVYVTRVILWSSFLPDPTDITHVACQGGGETTKKPAQVFEMDIAMEVSVTGNDSPCDFVFGEECFQAGSWQKQSRCI
jgi:hypothetical protein